MWSRCARGEENSGRGVSGTDTPNRPHRILGAPEISGIHGLSNASTAGWRSQRAFLRSPHSISRRGQGLSDATPGFAVRGVGDTVCRGGAKGAGGACGQKRCEGRASIFDAPYADADFTHWAKAAYWTLEEAIALAFGRSPEVVNWKKLESYRNVSPFVAEYAKVRDFAIRAKNWNQLYDPVYPSIYLAWAKRNDIGYPEGLGELVVKYGQNIGDWKTAYDNLKENFDAQKAQYDALVDGTKKDSAKVGQKVAALVEERDALLGQIADLKAPGKPLNPKERESVLRLIIGIAIKGYSYNPSMSRSPIAREIADDLAETGLPLSEDTVRKWLKEAAELLPAAGDLD